MIVIITAIALFSLALKFGDYLAWKKLGRKIAAEQMQLESDNASGNPVGNQLAREMGIKI